MRKCVWVLVGGVVARCFGQNDWLASPALALTAEPAGLSGLSAPHWQQAPRPSITATADIVPQTSSLSFLAKIPDLADTKPGRLLLCRVHRRLSGVCGGLLALKQRSGSTTIQRKGKHPLMVCFSNERAHYHISWLPEFISCCSFCWPFVICCFCLTFTVKPIDGPWM